jgi:hypothetical protein
MVYTTWDYWVPGLSPSSGILKNTMFRKLDLFPSSGEGMQDTCSVGSARKDNLNPWTTNSAGISHPSALGRKQIHCPKLCVFLEYGTMDKVQKFSNRETRNLLTR